MTICDKGHDEVCFEGRYCPVCEIIAERDETEKELREEIKNLEQTIAELEEGTVVIEE